MSLVNLILKNGTTKTIQMDFGELINIKIGSEVSIRVGMGFQPMKKFLKVSDYTLKEV